MSEYTEGRCCQCQRWTRALRADGICKSCHKSAEAEAVQEWLAKKKAQKAKTAPTRGGRTTPAAPQGA